MNTRDVVRRLKDDGWVLRKGKSGTSHLQFTHPTKPGKVTVTNNVERFPIGTLRSMERQSGLKFT